MKAAAAARAVRRRGGRNRTRADPRLRLSPWRLRFAARPQSSVVHLLCTTFRCLSSLLTGTHKLAAVKLGPSLLGVLHERACRFHVLARGAERRISRLRKNRPRLFGAPADGPRLGARLGGVYSGRGFGYERPYGTR